MKIYMIRHGQTDWNVARRLQGSADTELNQNGIALAEKTGIALKDVPFTRIYTSPLKRAYTTAMFIKRDRNIPVIKEERLREISFGEAEGLCIASDNYELKEPGFENIFFGKPEAYIPPAGGETIEELCKRTTSFLNEIVRDKSLENETILFSTHGAAMMGLLSSVNTPDIAHFWHGGVHKNCAVTLLDVKNGKITVVEEDKVYAAI